LRETERLNALITDFLLFAHPPLTRRTPWEVGKIIDETIELFLHSSFFHNGIHIARTDPHEKIEAMVDPDQLRQVFWNLLINAAQAISHGGDIRIQMEKGNGTFSTPSLLLPIPGREKGWTKVMITDSGAGIASHEKDKIFEPFYTTRETGTGLGLAVVSRIMETYGGKIDVQSEPGKGTIFTIWIPVGNR
jgi:two-component system, sporulation sensor kinase E